jgi:peptidoglycan/LPS O-acetylase OafA/YrhL
MATSGRDKPGGPAAFHLGYRPWLDGLRGVAILLVLAYHLGLLTGGFLGVDVFFVLSGFLITSLLVEEWQRRGAISFRHFYLRRALRLLPAYFTLLLACYLCVLLFRPAEAAAFRREMLVAACYASNLPGLHRPGLTTLGHTWSLSLEEQFYLLWPLLLYGMLRCKLGRRGTLLAVCAGILASASLRYALFKLYRIPGPAGYPLIIRLYSCLDTRADSLLTGCLVALLAAWDLFPRSPRFRRATGVAALASAAALGYILLTMPLHEAKYYRGWLTLVALMVGTILVRLLTGRVWLASAVLESRPLVFVGRISYGLYLVHMPIILWVRPESRPAAALLAAGLSFAAAVVLHYAVERPFLRLKDRLRAPSPVARPAEPLTRRRAA